MVSERARQCEQCGADFEAGEEVETEPTAILEGANQDTETEPTAILQANDSGVVPALIDRESESYLRRSGAPTRLVDSVDRLASSEPGKWKGSPFSKEQEGLVAEGRPRGKPGSASATTKPTGAVPLTSQETDEWQTGEIILGLYEVLEVLGEGSMGKVYRVHHRGWDVDLAVKCPKAGIFSWKWGAENFEREAETWVNLGLHPNVVSCYYVRRVGGMPRVFTEFIEQGSLHDWLRTERLYEDDEPRTIERILHLSIQMAWGLAHSHNRGLIHQDVKPANILMGFNGTAKVTDFGLARARAMSGGTGPTREDESVMVTSGGMTPAYCSPEQAEGRLLTRRTDIYSWAVTVFQMFYGRPNWRLGPQAGERLGYYLELQPKQAKVPVMPDGMGRLLTRCLEHDPEARPKAMPQIVEELRGIYRNFTGQDYAREDPRPAEAMADGLNNRAISLLDLGKQKEAENHLQAILDTEANHPQATYNLGLLHWRAGKITDDVLVHRLERACASHSDQWEPTSLLALVHLERGDAQSAMGCLREIRAADPEQPEIQSALDRAESLAPNSRRLLQTFQEKLVDPVWSVCLSRDGRYILAAGGTGNQRGECKLWDVNGGQRLRSLRRHRGLVTSVAFSPDGAFALSGSEDQTLILWDVAAALRSGRVGDAYLRTFQGHMREVLDVAFSHSGDLALSGSRDNTLKLWDIASGRCVRSFTGHRTAVESVCFSADDQWALTGSGDRSLKLWDMASGECLQTFKGHGLAVHSVQLCKEKDLAVSGSSDKTVRIWKLSSGECVRVLEAHAGSVTAVAISRDGRKVLSGSEDRTLRLWNRANGRCLRTFRAHSRAVTSVHISHDGARAVTGSNDRTIRLWSLEGAEVAPTMLCRVLAVDTMVAYQDALRQGREAQERGLLAAAALAVRKARAQPGCEQRPEALLAWAELYRRLPRTRLKRAWEVTTFQGHESPITSIAVSTDGKTAISTSGSTLGASGQLKVWDLAALRCAHTLKGHSEAITSSCLGADGSFALSGSKDGTVLLWDLDSAWWMRRFERDPTRHWFRRRARRPEVHTLAVTADGRFFFTAGSDPAIQMWDMDSGQPLRQFEGHRNAVNAIALSPDESRLASASSDRTVRLWDIASGKCLTVLRGHRGLVTSVVFDPRGRSLASAAYDWSIRSWDLETGRCLHVLEGHQGVVTSLCSSADGHFLLSGSRDQTARLWNTGSAECCHTFEGHTGPVSVVQLSADGQFAISGSEDRSLKVWWLDWELEELEMADWSDGALPFLQVFLKRHRPYAAEILPGMELSEQALQQALTRTGEPEFSDRQFDQFLEHLGRAGFGWLRPEAVRARAASRAGTPVPGIEPVRRSGITPA